MCNERKSYDDEKGVAKAERPRGQIYVWDTHSDRGAEKIIVCGSPFRQTNKQLRDVIKWREGAQGGTV